MLSIGILLIKKPFDAFCPINPCSLLFGFGVSPTCKRLGKQKDAACAIADILVVLITDASTLRCNAISRFSKELDWLFIHADHRILFVIWTAINLQDILHRGNE